MEICVPCYPPIANNRHDWIARGNFTARAQFDLLLSLEEYRRVHGHAINGDMSLVLIHGRFGGLAYIFEGVLL